MIRKNWEKSSIRAQDLIETHPLTEEQKESVLENLSHCKTKNVSPQQAYDVLKAYRSRSVNHTLSFQMLKGGVAKTSSALNIGIRAAQYGLKVLMIDLDQQANLSFALGVISQDCPVWLDIVEKKVTPLEAVVPIFQNLDLIPSHLNNSVLEKVLLRTHRNWANAVKTPLLELKNLYDWIIIDTAPSLSLVNTAITCASDLVVLPVSPDPFSIVGLKKHLEELEEMKKEFELPYLNKKILLTRFDARQKLSQTYLDQIAEAFPEDLLDSYIRTSSDIQKTIQEGKTIFQAQCYAKQDYDLVTKELLLLLEGGTYAQC
jgi:chromosome partitioning protein